MSPVNLAGSVSEISPRHYFFLKKNHISSYEKPGWLGHRDLGFCDRDLGNRDEKFSI